MMTSKQFKETLFRLVKNMTEMQYSGWLIQTVTGFLTITEKEKMEPMLNEFIALSEKNLPEMEFHHEINKVFQKYNPDILPEI